MYSTLYAHPSGTAAIPVWTASGSSTNSSPSQARWWVASRSNRAAPRSTTATVQVGCEWGRYAWWTNRAWSASMPSRPFGLK